jgi:hypothetical protein
MPATLQAQTRSDISGTVRDAGGGVLPGVTMTLSSPNLIGGAQTVVTNADGLYRFVDLLPGAYDLSASLQGFQTTKRAAQRMDAGAHVTIDLNMAVGAVSETVEVKAASPTINIKSAQSMLRIDEEQIQNLPSETRRSGWDLMLNAPGVTSERVAFGSTKDAHNLQIDGIPQGNGVNGARVSPNWAQEVQVVGLGAPAEYGEMNGVVSNMIIKSGSNRFSGLFDLVTGRPEWQGDNTGSLPEAQRGKFLPQITVKQWDASGQVGGPIAKDTLFFFTSYHYFFTSTLGAGRLSDVPTDLKWPKFIAKFNWAAHPKVRFETYFEKDKSSLLHVGSNAFTDTSAQNQTSQPKTSYNARVTWTPANNTLVEIRTAGVLYDSVTDPMPPGTRDGPPGHTNLSTSVASVNISQWSEMTSKRNVVLGTITQFIPGVLGVSHELKGGLEYEYQNANTKAGYPGGLYYQDLLGNPNQVTSWGGSTKAATAKRMTGFIQDNWMLSQRITLQPGLRMSADRGSVPGAKNVFKTNPADVRFGIAWDVTGSHKTLARAHVGRFHDGLYTGAFDFMDLSGFTPSIVYRIGTGGTLTEISRTAVSNVYRIASDLAHSYVDQVVVGVDRELFQDVSLTAQYIQREYKHILAFRELNRTYTPTTVTDPGPDGKVGTTDDVGALMVYNRDNVAVSYELFGPPDAKRHYRGFQLIAKKRYSKNWQATLAMTWSRTEGNVNNAAGSNTAVAGGDGGISGEWATPNARINAYGRASLDAPFSLQLQATYRLPFWGGFNTSVNYRRESGLAWGRTANFTVVPGSITVRTEPRGTRRSPTANTLNMRVEKTFSLGHRRQIGVFVDAFNVANAGVARGYQELSGTAFGQVTAWNAPRTLSLGGRFTF